MFYNLNTNDRRLRFYKKHTNRFKYLKNEDTLLVKHA